MMVHDDNTGVDPRGLIRDAFAMEKIAEPECRTIFLDWALGLDEDPKSFIPDLIDRYVGDNKNHPMAKILVEGLRATPSPRRRKGRNG